MNQKNKRSSDRKRIQDISASTMNTGGHIAAHRRGAEAEVRVPQKATGDVPADKVAGAAKASPFFRELKEVLPTSKAEEKKVVAKATEKPIAKADAKVSKVDNKTDKVDNKKSKVDKDDE